MSTRTKLLVGTYKTTTTQKFIDHRDRRAPEYTQGIFGADCELPEHHQCEIDPKQTLHEGAAFDTTHEDLDSLDYKLYSQEGVHLRPWIQKQISAGLIKHLVIWKWKNGYKELYLNQEVEYIILGVVDAKLALEQVKRNGNNRFDFNKIQKVEEYV